MAKSPKAALQIRRRHECRARSAQAFARGVWGDFEDETHKQAQLAALRNFLALISPRYCIASVQIA